MTVFIRPPRKEGETDEEYRKRDEEHWDNVAKAEEALLKLRERFKPTKAKVRKV